MKNSEIRSISLEELKVKITNLRNELFKLKIQHSMGQLENTTRLSQVKKDIARTLTILRERQINNEY